MPKKMVNLTISSPAKLGLNTQEENTDINNAWATRASNCVYDDTGRLSSRKGSQNINTTAVSGSPSIKQIHEYIDKVGDRAVIFAGGNKIYKVDGASTIDVTGTITTPSADNWKFQNFNGKCVGFQAGHAPIVMSTTTGSFADIVIASGSASSNEVLSAFGRLWIIDGSDLKYCAALDETHWTTGAGSFDLATVWLHGMDVPIALAEFNGFLVVFGKTSIIIYDNPWTPTGTGTMDTSVMSLVENISGMGCIARDTVQHVGQDIIFLSNKGIRSLGRTIQNESMPISDISINVNDALISDVNADNLDDIRGVFAPQEGFYLLTLPSSDKTYYFDMRQPTEAGSFRTTTWDRSFNSIVSLQSGDIYFGLDGFVAKYSGFLDDILQGGAGGTKYTMSYHSTWTSINEEVVDLLKLAKNFKCLVYGGRGQNVTIKWAFDYLDTFKSVNRTILGQEDIAEWGVAEYGIDEYGGGDVFHELSASLTNSGRVIKVGFDIEINGNQISLQQIIIQAKLGRIA